MKPNKLNKYMSIDLPGYSESSAQLDFTGALKQKQPYKKLNNKCVIARDNSVSYTNWKKKYFMIIICDF